MSETTQNIDLPNSPLQIDGHAIPQQVFDDICHRFPSCDIQSMVASLGSDKILKNLVGTWTHQAYAKDPMTFSLIVSAMSSAAVRDVIHSIQERNRHLDLEKMRKDADRISVAHANKRKHDTAMKTGDKSGKASELYDRLNFSTRGGCDLLDKKGHSFDEGSHLLEVEPHEREPLDAWAQRIESKFSPRG